MALMVLKSLLRCSCSTFQHFYIKDHCFLLPFKTPKLAILHRHMAIAATSWACVSPVHTGLIIPDFLNPCLPHSFIHLVKKASQFAFPNTEGPTLGWKAAEDFGSPQKGPPPTLSIYL